MTVLDETAQPATTALSSPSAPTTKDATMTMSLSPDSTLLPESAASPSPVEQTHDAYAADQRDTGTKRVTFGRLVSSEWLKFRTVRSNLLAIAGAVVAAIGFGALFSSLAGSGEGPDRLGGDALSLSLGGFQLSQIIIAILGVALVAGEYQSGLLRTWFGAAPNRLQVLAAKTTVYGALVFVVAMITAIVAFTVGQALLPSTMVALSLGSAGVFQALLGTAFYAAIIAMIGIGLGFLLRSTAAGAGAVVSMLMLAPLMVGLLPSSISDPLGKILPSNAATAVQGVQSGSELLSAGWGVAVLLAWVVAIIGAAAVSLTRRDA